MLSLPKVVKEMSGKKCDCHVTFAGGSSPVCGFVPKCLLPSGEAQTVNS